jgi:hypothetical protein
LLFSLIPALILGVVINIVQNYERKAESYEEEVRNIVQNYERDAENHKDDIEAHRKDISLQMYKNDTLNHALEQQSTQLENSIHQLDAFMKSAGTTLNLYTAYRALLKRDSNQQNLMRQFLNRAMEPVVSIWDVSDKEFYDLALRGIKACHKCQVIHHGKISNLQKEFSYLDELRSSKVESQRIVVLSMEDAKELADDAKIHDFLNAVGKTPSYWIDEDDFFEITRIRRTKDPSKETFNLNDCALLDGQLLLFRHRKAGVAVLSFKEGNEATCKGIIDAFDYLNAQLTYANYRPLFTLIKEKGVTI